MSSRKSITGVEGHKVERSFFRNGSLREHISFAGKQLHGARRLWHPNGRLAFEEFYEHGLAHGRSRQWNQRGKLLGSYRMNHGTGIQREWFPDGQLQFEASRVNGFFTGRLRTWLRDGSLASECFVVENRNVSRERYNTATRKNPEYPRFPAGKVRLRDEDELDRRELELHIEWLLSQRNKCEIQKWLAAGARHRSLGFFKFAQAKQLTRKLSDAGALQIFAVNICSNKGGKQFSDALLVKLPVKKSARQTIRRLLVKQPAKLRGGILPAKDKGEPFLFCSLV